jgi:hypothetical protein
MELDNIKPFIPTGYYVIGSICEDSKLNDPNKYYTIIYNVVTKNAYNCIITCSSKDIKHIRKCSGVVRYDDNSIEYFISIKESPIIAASPCEHIPISETQCEVFAIEDYVEVANDFLNHAIDRSDVIFHRQSYGLLKSFACDY